MLARDSQDIIRPQTMSNRQFQQENPLLVLAVDTSSTCASLAIAYGEMILASIKTDAPIPHSKTFFNLLSSLLQSADKSLAEIDAFAAATGPGSFTGLRVGLAAIKGLSHAVGKPAVGIGSIDALALTSNRVGKVLVMINAGREEVYAGLRILHCDKNLELLGLDMVGSVSSVFQSFDQFIQEDSLTIIRMGFSKQDGFQNLAPGWQMINANNNHAEGITIYAARILATQNRFDLRPHYIRPSDAEINRKD